MQTTLKTQMFRDALESELTSRSGKTTVQIADLLKRFDKSAAATSDGAELGYRVFVNAYANTGSSVEEKILLVKKAVKNAQAKLEAYGADFKPLLKPAAQTIHGELEKLSSHPGIKQLSPLQRIRMLIAAHNSKLDAMNVAADGQPILTAEEIQQAKMIAPQVAQAQQELYEAFAARGGVQKLRALEFDFRN